jgi:hypothetical protein
MEKVSANTVKPTPSQTKHNKNIKSKQNKVMYYSLLGFGALFVLLMVGFTLNALGVFDSLSFADKVKIFNIPPLIIGLIALSVYFIKRHKKNTRLTQQLKQSDTFIQEFNTRKKSDLTDDFELADAVKNRLAELPTKDIQTLDLFDLSQAFKDAPVDNTTLQLSSGLNLASPWLEFLFNHFSRANRMVEVDGKTFIAHKKSAFFGYNITSKTVFYTPSEVTSNYLEKDIAEKQIMLPPKPGSDQNRKATYRQALPMLARAIQLPNNAGEILSRIEAITSPNSRFSQAYQNLLIFRAQDFKFWDTLYRCQSEDVRKVAYQILRTIKEFYDIIGSDDDVLGQSNKISIYTEFAAKFTIIRVLSKDLADYFSSHEFVKSISQEKEGLKERKLLKELADIYEGMPESVRASLPKKKLENYKEAYDGLQELDNFVAMETAFNSVGARLNELKELINVEQIHALSGMIDSLRKLIEGAKLQLKDNSEIDNITGENLDELLDASIKRIVKDSNVRIYSLADDVSINELVDIYQKVKTIILEELEKLNLTVFEELDSVDDL